MEAFLLPLLKLPMIFDFDKNHVKSQYIWSRMAFIREHLFINTGARTFQNIAKFQFLSARAPNFKILVLLWYPKRTLRLDKSNDVCCIIIGRVVPEITRGPQCPPPLRDSTARSPSEVAFRAFLDQCIARTIYALIAFTLYFNGKIGNLILY